MISQPSLHLSCFLFVSNQFWIYNFYISTWFLFSIALNLLLVCIHFYCTNCISQPGLHWSCYPQKLWERIQLAHPLCRYRSCIVNVFNFSLFFIFFSFFSFCNLTDNRVNVNTANCLKSEAEFKMSQFDMTCNAPLICKLTNVQICMFKFTNQGLTLLWGCVSLSIYLYV